MTTKQPNKKNISLKSENKILNTIHSMIEKEKLANNTCSDILILLKGALQHTNNHLDLLLVFKIYTLLIKQMPLSQNINNLIFINFYSLFKYIYQKDPIQKTYIQKYFLLLEYYLMQYTNHILKEQIELILYIIEECINKEITIFYFKYGFLYLKLYDLIQSKKLTNQLKNQLTKTKQLIIDISPATDEANKLKDVILSKFI